MASRPEQSPEVSHAPQPRSSSSHSQPGDDTPNPSAPIELKRLSSKARGKRREGDNAEEELYHTPPRSPTSQTPPPQPAERALQSIDPKNASQTVSAPVLKREVTTTAIGPASDKPTPLPKEAEWDKILMLSLLTPEGTRHPYKIDAKYLQKRNVSVEDDNPTNLSIYDLKNLIWRDWRPDWVNKPTNPSSIRLIYGGQMPGDNMRLGDCKFILGPTNHIVHMTVKPQDFIDEEEAAKGAGRDREGSERSPKCRCCIIM